MSYYYKNITISVVKLNNCKPNNRVFERFYIVIGRGGLVSVIYSYVLYRSVDGKYCSKLLFILLFYNKDFTILRKQDQIHRPMTLCFGILLLVDTSMCLNNAI
jgi:hypothetical protein